jgi:hypothetical protein
MMHVGGQQPEQPQGEETRRVTAHADRLDLALTGSLPCVTCGYELKGLSIRGVCPECGTTVRAAILWQVDPLAEEFRPIVRPGLLALGIRAWAAGALIAALASWGLRIADMIERQLLAPIDTTWLSAIVLIGAALSAAGSLAIIRPTPTSTFRHAVMASIGALAYVPLLWAMWRVHWQIDPTGSQPYFSATADPQRIALHLLVSGSTILIVLGFRPNARDLVRRSLVMRMGRVDRQTLYVMAGVIALTMVGDAIRLGAAQNLSPHADLWSMLGTLLIALGSALFTLGLVGAAIDSWRISRAILIPAPSLKQVLGGHDA